MLIELHTNASSLLKNLNPSDLENSLFSKKYLNSSIRLWNKYLIESKLALETGNKHPKVAFSPGWEYE